MKSLRMFGRISHDILMAGASFWLALYVRLGDEIPAHVPYWLEASIFFGGLSAIIFALFRLHKSMWRYTSLNDLQAIVKAVTVSILVFLLVLFILLRLEGFPRSVFFLQWVSLILMLVLPRVLFRILIERSFSLGATSAREGLEQIPVLIIGINEQAEHFLREMEHTNADYRVVGIISEDQDKDGRSIRGIRVYSNRAALKKVLDKLERREELPQKILIAEEDISGVEVAEIVAVAEASGVNVARLPRITDLKQAQDAKRAIRPIRVEDLLGRHQNAQDLTELTALIEGSCVMVTGAGGTIGSELVRQIVSYAPKQIILFDSSEHNLYQIDHELQEHYPDVVRLAVIGNVRDSAKLGGLFESYQPEIVFHAAALKHVPLSEVNAEEAITTNVYGTKFVADLALKHNIKAMVLISTDKAVHPSNIMGTTKRVAEQYCQALGQLPNAARTKFVTLRFGNVLGSSGSVIPLFYKQLEQGGPLTVTHPQMTRYFMTVREAVELVLQATALATSSEEKSMIYVLDMGEPVRIVDLARQMIRLGGFKDDEIDIRYVGLRPGEKLYEELFYEAEAPSPTRCQGVMIAAPKRVAYVEVDNYMRKLLECVARGDRDAMMHTLRLLVPEYKVDDDAA